MIAIVLGCGSVALGADAVHPHVSDATVAKVRSLVENDTPRLQEVFQDIHQHPELGFMETRTSAIVAKALKSLGFDVTTGIGETGVVGVLKNGDGPVVAYRADMDANAVEEATGLPYASHVRVTRADGLEVPVAHQCGHDAHTTWMLGMAKAMVALKREWSGTLILVGQPAEEIILGARAMVDDGLWTSHGLPKPDFLVGLHTVPTSVGTVSSTGGVLMAGTDQLDVLFRGVGGHGSTPHLTKDPVVMAALAVVEYQTIVSRLTDPKETAVLTVGSIQAGTDNNVIPANSLLKLNLRWFNPAIREQMVGAIRAMSDHIALSYGVSEDQLPVITMKGSSTPMITDAALAGRLAGALDGLVGQDNVIRELPARLGSEDFHLLLGPHSDVPYAYLFVGVADPEVYEAAVANGHALPYTLHSPQFVVDPDAIPLGAEIATVAMLELVGRPG
jgi:hippurate hydrolase